MLLTILAISCLVQIAIQWWMDQQLVNMLFGKWAPWWRYKLATNFAWRLFWNTGTSVVIGTIIFGSGNSGLLMLTSVLLANVTYEGICRLFMYKHWINYYDEQCDVIALEQHRGKIRKALAKKMRGYHYSEKDLDAATDKILAKEKEFVMSKLKDARKDGSGHMQKAMAELISERTAGK